jgi:hypothetical protein
MKKMRILSLSRKDKREGEREREREKLRILESSKIGWFALKKMKTLVL